MSVNSHIIYQYTVHTLIMTDKYIKLEKKNIYACAHKMHMFILYAK